MFGMNVRFLGISELDEVPPVAVVVDVMRAFTTAAWAFAREAEKIVLAGSVDEAVTLKAPGLDGAEGRSARCRIRPRQLSGLAAIC